MSYIILYLKTNKPKVYPNIQNELILLYNRRNIHIEKSTS